VDILGSEMTASTQAVMTILRAAGMDSVMFDPHVIANAASASIDMIESKVNSAMDVFKPILKWIKIIIGTIIALIILSLIIFILIKIKSCRDKERAEVILKQMLPLTDKSKNQRVRYTVGKNEEEAIAIEDTPP
jgi:predicted PurR-regulated permease PerM